MSWNPLSIFRRKKSSAPPPRPGARPRLEALEERYAPVIGINLNAVTGLTGLVNPLQVTNAQDASNRLFVVEQRGSIRVLVPTAPSSSVFLNLSGVTVDGVAGLNRVRSGGEQGLLGLAFHPDYETNGRFFVHYTTNASGSSGNPVNRIAEYQVDPDNANQALSTETLILEFPAQPFGNHNGGSIEFGPDGLLYIAKGDGGSANDPGNRAQNVNELFGKILRIDVNRDDFPSDGNRNYGIPPDNPYVGVAGADEIFAIGMRNPYRFSFDRGTGLLYVGDVGQGAREEIDIVVIGGNYGWRPYEGNIGTPAIGQAERNAILPFALFPLTDYVAPGGGRSVTGGYVYRGTESALPVGSYLFADYITGQIFLYNNGTTTELRDEAFNISSFGEDEAGELYVVRYGNGNGQVYKVVSSSTNLAPAVEAIANQTIPSSQDTVAVTVSASDANGDPLTLSATAQSLALVLDRQLGLRTDGGNLYEDFFGAGERWLLGRNGSSDWYFLLPNGELYRWDSQPSATGTLVGTPGATYYQQIDLLYNAELAYDLDLTRQLRTDGGNLYEDFFGAGERWLLDRNNNWHFILPNGQLYFWDLQPSATGTLVATPGPSYHALIRLLYEGDQGQALATLQYAGNDLTVDRDDGFVASVVVTAVASDGELTGGQTFTVTVTA